MTKRFLFAGLALAATLMITACAGGVDQVKEKVRTDLANTQLGDGKIIGLDVDAAGAKLVAFTLADATAALDDAKAHNDFIAAQCWQGVVDHLPQINGENSVMPKGVLSAYQKARNLRRGLGDGVSDSLKLACGPLIVDAQGNIMRLMAKLGGGPLGGLIP